jgi:TonB family protein
MKTHVFLLIGFITFLPVNSDGEDRSKWLSAAVDANGFRYKGSDYPNGGMWMKDSVYRVAPQYSESERAQRHFGSGLLRLTLDLKTGTVTKVQVLQSTGFAALDQSAIDAFRRWRWKPGKWKEIDVPLTFAMSRSKTGLYIGSKPVPASR